uniref:Uncharacterized protein n=1 Tax=Solanum lycopersicum TaxID=4081 RepID=A0A3Q7GPU5_SOLLC
MYFNVEVDNINTVEEADAYKEYLVSAMERVQRSNETVVLDDRGYYMHVIEKQEQEVIEQQKLEVTNSFNQEIENVVPRIVTDKADHVVKFAVPGPTKMSTINTQTPTWEGSECSIIHAMMINACILRSEFVAVDVT